MATIQTSRKENSVSPMPTESKKRKIIADCACSSENFPQNKETVQKDSQEYQSNETCENIHSRHKKVRLMLPEDEKSSNKKSSEKINQKGKNKKTIYHNKDNENKEDADNKIELKIWHCLLHHLDEAEKLIVLKILVEIKKIKNIWKENCGQSLEKKVVNDLKSVIKTLQNKQEENEKERQKLLREISRLEKKLKEERKCRLQLAESLVNVVENYQTLIEKNFERDKSGKIEDSHKEKDLRTVLNSRENGGYTRNHKNRVPQPIRNTPPFHPYPHYTKGFFEKVNEEFCVLIKGHGVLRENFQMIRKSIELKMGTPIRFKRVIPLNGSWKIEFFSEFDKFTILNQRWMFNDTGIFIVDASTGL